MSWAHVIPLMCDILTQVVVRIFFVFPHPPTQVMYLLSSFAPVMMWSFCVFAVAFTASILQVHTIALMLLDGVELLAFSIMVCFIFGIIMWQIAYVLFYSKAGGPRTQSQGTQTTDDLPCLSTIYASKSGKCYHVSARCPINGGHQDVVPLRRCRNCG